MKTAIIVGATSGIGRNLATLLADNDYHVGITGRRTQLLEEIKSEDPDKYITADFDTTHFNTIAANLDQLAQQLGRLDLLVISSGIGSLTTKLRFDIEKQTIDTNVSGFTAVADWAFNYFQQQGYGHLAAISSIAGIRGNHQSPSYSATKAYQINYLESLRIKAVKTSRPIFITDIRPGFVNTDMAKGDGLFWVAPVEKAAGQILNAIRRKKRTAYITKRWGVIGRVLKLLPNWAIDKL
jgi:short-subunit dehydrogenase